MAKRDLHLENLQWLDQQLSEGQIGQAEYDLRKERLLASAKSSPTTNALLIGLLVLVVVFILGGVLDRIFG